MLGIILSTILVAAPAEELNYSLMPEDTKNLLRVPSDVVVNVVDEKGNRITSYRPWRYVDVEAGHYVDEGEKFHPVYKRPNKKHKDQDEEDAPEKAPKKKHKRSFVDWFKNLFRRGK